ncbi:DUF885 domain-containing protein [Litorimonas sp. RW-G-Af-16]|uniref:DUF885 domain-containing protein n=2 Tax=Litorimonas sp. RW-G-Af-16 TaxID=3241168 RepID=UPI00390C4A13
MRRLLTAMTVSLLLGTTALSACQPTAQDRESRAEMVRQESEALNAWFAARYEDELARSPMTQTYLGQKDNQSKLDDNSQLALDEGAALQEAWLTEMRRDFDVDRLDPQTRLSYQLYEFAAEDALATHKVGDHDYVFQHMSGPHSDLPSFMINFHQIKTAQDAQDYISRLTQFPTYLGQAEARAQAQAEAGVVLPKFVYAKVSDASRNVISGAPFEEDATEDSPLWADIQAKINGSDATDSEKEALLTSAKDALLGSVQPAYISLLAMFDAHAAMATDEDGAWKLPNGEDYYATRLKHYTTTDMTADEIHEVGLAEVARIQDEMRAIMKQVEFDGTLQEFFTYLRTDPKFVYPNTDEGRDAYIKDATQIIDDMKARTGSLFNIKPKADMIVKRVEPFREDTAFGAFYDLPAMDGSRPGTYYINLKTMEDQPKFLQQALAYHEGIPGHHMQIALAMELEGLPKFRTLGGHTAYIEGWALYAEAVPAELGMYTDPYSDFGRLSMEIFRAARLVVDTGIHSKKWTREEAVQYYLDNIANPEGDIRAEIDRYIVWPGQATAYKIGMLKIGELKKKAETELGDDFNIAAFHDVVLASGSVPLSVLEDMVDTWIKETKAGA